MSIKPGIYNGWSIEKGETFSESVLIKIDGTPLDLQTSTVQAQLRSEDRRTSKLLGDFTTSVDVDNYITLTMDKATTAGLTGQTGYFDILVTDAAGGSTYYLEGKMPLNNSVTVEA